MEPTILSTIIWGVIWLFAGHFVTVLIVWASALSGGLIGAAKSKGRDDKTPLGILGGAAIGWIIGAAWEIFVIIQVVIHIVTLIQLLIAGAS